MPEFRLSQIDPSVVETIVDHHSGNILNMLSCQLKQHLSTLCRLHSPQLSSVTSQGRESNFDTVILVAYPACFAQ